MNTRQFNSCECEKKLVLTLKKFKEKNFPTVLKYQTEFELISNLISFRFICFKNALDIFQI
ncbi:hypothetical protein BpHYR1_002131 [Brachionus plicatilis]|uniref:Uncharacterized protein n=1 Tax=Brachionus plicatilis TaxID=10195 RepID=A0A3M7RX04_BRAPC|nr:hypothetical protein BpHYR1_002131 [Brachionus plicatilis]